MREILRRNRRPPFGSAQGRRETEDTILGAIVQTIGYAVLTGAAVWLLMGHVP